MLYEAKMAMNDKTWQVYDFIRGYIKQHGYAPTHREITTGSHISSDMVTYFLSTLAAHELIEYTPGVPRGIKLKQAPPCGGKGRP
jgi:SOS-response transcriptional repressor LexA